MPATLFKLLSQFIAMVMYGVPQIYVTFTEYWAVMICEMCLQKKTSKTEVYVDSLNGEKVNKMSK